MASDKDIYEHDQGTHVITYPCPCGTHHGRQEYKDTTKGFLADGQWHRVLICPNDRDVYMRYDNMELDSNGDLSTDIQVEDIPLDANVTQFPSGSR